jgi:sugar transferase (PEP-CTERM/EpsH1 system associated)
MNVLFLAHRLPYPLDKGEKIRAYHEIRSLAGRGHAIHLLAFAECEPDAGDLRHLAVMCDSIGIVPFRLWPALARAAFALVSDRSLSVAYFASRRMRALVDEALLEREIDAIVTYSSTMAQYVPPAWASRAVADLVDADSAKWRDYVPHTRPPASWIYRLEAERLHRHEREIVDRFACSIVCAAREARAIERRAGHRSRLHVIANGVDLANFPSPATPVPLPDAHRPDGTAPSVSDPRLVFVGVMSYLPNQDAACFFAHEVLPLVRRRYPRTRFIVVGSNPGRPVRRLARLPGVTVTGKVPDVRPYLDSATVSVVPLRIARGIQNKLLEAMAARRPTVATPQAAEGLDLSDGQQILIADGARGLAAAVVRMLDDPWLRQRLAVNGRRFVEERHQWTGLLDRLGTLVEAVGAAGPAVGRPRRAARR